jgi:hypothetical protein
MPAQSEDKPSRAHVSFQCREAARCRDNLVKQWREVHMLISPFPRVVLVLAEHQEMAI